VPYLIGTDEAGYGPNLGPLTVTGTLWKVDDASVDPVDLYSSLPESVRQTPKGDGIFIADSKRVYSSGSISELETSVLSLIFSMTGRIPSNWLELLEAICPSEFIDRIPDQTWLAGRELDLAMKPPKLRLSCWKFNAHQFSRLSLTRRLKPWETRQRCFRRRR